MSTSGQSGAPGKRKRAKIVHHLPNPLAAKLKQPGGMRIDKALQAATENVETLRIGFVAAIPGEISTLAAMLPADPRSGVTPSQLEAMMERAGFVLTLSGTFGFNLLDAITKKFCDLCNGMVDQSLSDAAPLRIHVEAMRLACPSSALLRDEAGGALLLQQLGKIHDHLNIKPIGAIQKASDTGAGNEN